MLSLILQTMVSCAVQRGRELEPHQCMDMSLENFGMTFPKDRIFAECHKFTEMELNQHSGKTLATHHIWTGNTTHIHISTK
jgi:hypothetical protein